MNYNVVAATNEDTVVATYEPSKVRSDSYQNSKFPNVFSMFGTTNLNSIND